MYILNVSIKVTKAYLVATTNMIFLLEYLLCSSMSFHSFHSIPSRRSQRSHHVTLTQHSTPELGAHLESINVGTHNCLSVIPHDNDS